MDYPMRFGGEAGAPVPEVDPDDLTTLWREQNKLQAAHPGQQIGADLLKYIT